MPLFNNPGAPHREVVFSECVGVDGKPGEGHRMARSNSWKLILSDADEEFLFDMDNDPYEMTNRVGDPEQARRLGRLRGELGRWMTAIGDRPYPPVGRPGADGDVHNESTTVETTISVD